MKEVRDGTSGDDSLGIKYFIYQPGARMFSWTILIQFFQSQVGFPPQSSLLLELLLNYAIW